MKIGEKSGKTQSSELSGKFAEDAFASGCKCALHLKGSHQENNRGDRIEPLGRMDERINHIEKKRGQQRRRNDIRCQDILTGSAGLQHHDLLEMTTLASAVVSSASEGGDTASAIQKTTG